MMEDPDVACLYAEEDQPNDNNDNNDINDDDDVDMEEKQASFEYDSWLQNTNTSRTNRFGTSTEKKVRYKHTTDIQSTNHRCNIPPSPHQAWNEWWTVRDLESPILTEFLTSLTRRSILWPYIVDELMEFWHAPGNNLVSQLLLYGRSLDDPNDAMDLIPACLYQMGIEQVDDWQKVPASLRDRLVGTLPIRSADLFSKSAYYIDIGLCTLLHLVQGTQWGAWHQQQRLIRLRQSAPHISDALPLWNIVLNQAIAQSNILRVEHLVHMVVMWCPARPLYAEIICRGVQGRGTLIKTAVWKLQDEDAKLSPYLWNLLLALIPQNAVALRQLQQVHGIETIVHGGIQQQNSVCLDILHHILTLDGSMGATIVGMDYASSDDATADNTKTIGTWLLEQVLANNNNNKNIDPVSRLVMDVWPHLQQAEPSLARSVRNRLAQSRDPHVREWMQQQQHKSATV